MLSRRRIQDRWWPVALMVWAWCATDGAAQRVRLPAAYGAADSERMAQTVPWGAPEMPPSLGPGATLPPGIQPFDPYALPSGAPGLPAPLGYGGMGGAGSLPTAPPFEAPPSLPPASSWPAPGLNSPWINSGSGGYGPGGYGAPGSSSLFPNGLWTGRGGPPYQRLFQDTGFRHTWLAGSSNESLQINETEVSTSAYFPNFLRGRGPLRVTPGFVFHFLDGPEPPVTSDLPSRLYSAYLDCGWDPEFSPQFGADVNFRTGVFSDFNTFTFDSLRFMGTGVGIIRVTPAMSLKLGATYIDRAKIKILPAAGILWQPNPQTRWDIFFPSPKLASYWTTVGNSQLWWYLAGEYGGGSWTMERPDEPLRGAAERIDINDIRAIVGLEWHNLNRWYGFVEAGYVFKREIYYVVVPSDRVKLDDTVMVRAGISF